VDGFYDSTQTNTSFIGWGPIDDPQFMIFVWLSAHPNPYGLGNCRACLCEMAEKTIILLDIPPDFIRQQLAAK